MTTDNYKNSRQPMLTPDQLYPIVHEIPDDDFENKGGSIGRGESFAGLQLQDLSPFWNSLCPCELYQIVDDNAKDESSRLNAETSNNALAPVIRCCPYEKKDSVVTVIMSDPGLPECAVQQQPKHPLKAKAGKAPHGAPPRKLARRRNSQSQAPLDESNQESTHHDDTEPKTSPLRRKLHIRRGSKHLMNKLFAGSRSNNNSSMSSSGSKNKSNCSVSSFTKDLSVTDFSAAEESQSQAFPEEASFKDCYILTQRVFQCPTSEIWACLDRYTGIQHCAKVVGNPCQSDFRELDLFHNLSQDGHPSLASLVDVFVEATRLVLVTQWEKGGNLMAKVYKDGPLKEEDVKAIAKSLLKGCDFLHSRDIVHADLRPENILLSGDSMAHDEFCAKITDFGSAVNLRLHGHGALYGGGHGTCGYSAPEVLERKELDTQADMWSLGCLVFFMLTGRSPFEENPSSKRHNTVKALRAEYCFPSEHFQHVSRSAKQFICNLIIADPSVRLTAAEALKHLWLRVEEEPQLRCRSSLGNAVCSDPPLLDSSLMCVASRQASALSPCPSPERKSGRKHHRRLSSLSKTLGKLFQTKDQQQTLHPLKKVHIYSAPELCSSTYTADSSEVPPVTLASRWTAQPTEQTKKHRRFFTAG